MTWLVFCLLPLVLQIAEGSYGNVQTCGVQYVKPGDDFEVDCRSDHAATTTVGSVVAVHIEQLW